MSGDPYWSDVAFLSGFEGSSIVDESSLAQTVTVAGSAAQSTTQFKYGSKSLRRPAAGDYITVPDNAAFFSGTAHFTVEGWFYWNTKPSNEHGLMGQGDRVSDRGWNLYYNHGATSGARYLDLEIYDGASFHDAVLVLWEPALSTWYHIAADFDGTKYRLYVDGVLQQATTASYSLRDTTERFVVGGYLSGGSVTSVFDGYVDEVRITAGVARYASDSGFTPLTAAFERGAYVPASDTLVQGIGLQSSLTAVLKAGVTLAQSLRYADNLSVTKRYNPTVSEAINVQPALSYAFRPGAIISEVVRMQPSQAVAMRYGWTVNEQIYMTSALASAMPALVADGIGVAPAIAVSLGVSLLQGIGLAPVPLPSLRYTQTLVETIAMSPHLGLLFGALLSEHVGSHDALSTMYRPQPVLADGIGIAPTLSNKLMLTVVLNETIRLDDAQLLHAIYDGQLADQVQIVASYIAPNGNFTTWAMNTRSGAVTEYSNYAFNSFAMVGDRYYGAGPQGLYKLLGDTDDGTSIIADLKSGFAQWGGSKFTLLKYAYLGVRSAGTFVLKLITGDGKTYIYSAQAKNQQTTKVHLGKGLRARYFRFELIGDGADFDLDTIEFVPLVAERRD